MKTVVTKKGTVLPLTNLKGKDYLMTAYRLQWFVEENPIYHISETFLVINDEQTVTQVTITIGDDQGRVIRKAVGTKRETKVSFEDHTEKSATGALGRALIQLGYGTQYALADLDEGTRIVDSPLVDTKLAKAALAQEEHQSKFLDEKLAEPVKKPTFRKPKKVAAVETPVATTVTGNNGSNGSDGDGWIS